MSWSKLSNLLGRQRHKLGMSREESIAPATTVIVPLYIYPEPGAWKPLHTSIQSHRNAHFVVIVNPGNGPGPDLVPDENYLHEIPLLTAYPNVDVVGYVHTTFAQRDLSAVTHDILTYSNWAQQAQYPGLGISGIFVDETPNQYDVRAEKFLNDLTRFAKSRDGFGGGKLVIHNPGCVPTPAYLALADMTVVFEDTWQNFTTRLNDGIFDLQKVFGGAIPALHGNVARENLVMMVHSVPKNINSDRTKLLIRQVKQHAGAVFITDLDENYYSNWSSNWTNWATLIATMEAKT